MVTIKLGGANGTLRCARCGHLRWPGSNLCGDCYGKEQDGGTRNRRGVVIQQVLPKDVWQAVNFAGSMIRKGEPRSKAIRVAARYYDVDAATVQSALSQRGGRSRKRAAAEE